MHSLVGEAGGLDNDLMSDTPSVGDTDSDDALVFRARDGDREAFAMLYDRHARALALLLVRQFGDQCEDVLHDAFLKAWYGLSHFKEGSFRAWVYRIAKNHGADEVRRKQSREKVESAGRGIDTERGALDELIRREDEIRLYEREAQVRRCMDKLDERALALITSKYGGKVDHVELCARLKIPVDRGYKLRHAALNQLRKCVERGGG